MVAPPGVDGLILVPHDEQVFVVAAQDLHQLVLELVDVLKLVDHHVLQTALPLQADVRVLLKEIQGELDQIVVVQAEALLLLIEVAVKDDVGGGRCLVVLLLQGVQGHGDHVQVVVRPLEELLHLDHVPGGGEGHVPKGEPPLLVDELQHGVDVRVVQHQEALGVLDGVAVLLEDGDAEAVEGVDIAGVVVPGEPVDPLPHLRGRFVGEGDAQDVAGQDAQLVDQIGEPPGEGPGLA